MSAAIPYIRDFEPRYGQLVRIAPHVRRLVANNPGRFSGWGTNVYVIGSGAVSIVDPGPDTAEHFATLKAVLQDERVERVLVTHHHLDHSPLAPRLAAHYGCKTYGFGPPLHALAGGEVRLEAGDDHRFAPDVRIGDGTVFAGDGWSIEAVHTPGHTSNHMCYAVQPDNGLICGDHVLAWSTSVVSPPDGDMGAYLRSLEMVRQRGFAQLWPGHGPAVTDPAPFIDAYIAHRHARNRQILEALQEGHSRIKQMVPRIYADVDKRLYPAACHSVLAHMIQMVRDGRVACDGAPELDSDYRLA